MIFILTWMTRKLKKETFFWFICLQGRKGGWIQMYFYLSAREVGGLDSDVIQMIRSRVSTTSSLNLYNLNRDDTSSEGPRGTIVCNGSRRLREKIFGTILRVSQRRKHIEFVSRFPQCVCYRYFRLFSTAMPLVKSRRSKGK